MSLEPAEIRAAMPSIRVIAARPQESLESFSPPSNWASRALYAGPHGATRWLDVVHEPDYPLRDPHRFGLLESRFAAVEGLAVESFVSLGPGDGELDLALVASLQAARQRRGLHYLPVDLSRGLLEIAAARLSDVAEVPVALLCDFEADSGFLREALKRYAPTPRLLGLLGGTLGNLDLGEKAFFQSVQVMMAGSDALLLDVPLAGPGWNPQDEPRLNAQAYSAAFRRFLGIGGDSAQFERRASLSWSVDDETGAEVITVSDRTTERTLLLFRRFRWEFFLRWLVEQGFLVRYTSSSLSGGQDKFGMGVALLTLR